MSIKRSTIRKIYCTRLPRIGVSMSRATVDTHTHTHLMESNIICINARVRTTRNRLVHFNLNRFFFFFDRCEIKRRTEKINRKHVGKMLNCFAQTLPTVKESQLRSPLNPAAKRPESNQAIRCRVNLI